MATEVAGNRALLDQELAVFEEHRQQLLQDSEGKYVLIYRADVLGVFDSQLEAVHAGYRQLGHVPFLVKKIGEQDIPVWFSSGIIAG